jgi:hypothetical protein
MFRSWSRRWLAGPAAACLAAAPVAAFAQPVPPARLSVATDGTQGNDDSSVVDRSADGRHVLFLSYATNLVAGDTNAAADLFLRDRDTDRDGVLDEAGAVRTLRITEGPAGQQGTINGPGRLSPDGRFVLFATNAALVAEDTNGIGDVYLRDRDSDADGIFDESGAVSLERISTGTGGVEADSFSELVAMTANGRFVLFWTAATTLQPRPVTLGQIYRKDRQTGLTTIVSTAPDGTPGDLGTNEAVISPDGRFVAMPAIFVSHVSVPAGAPRFPWVLRDVDANTVTFIPLDAAPTVGDPGWEPAPAPIREFERGAVRAFSNDGRRLYLSYLQGTGRALRVTGGSTFEYDVAARSFTRRLAGIPPPTPGLWPEVAFEDGRTFTLTTRTVSNVGTATARDIFRYDADTGRSTPIVVGDVCAGFVRAATRVLYDPTCAALSGPPTLLDTTFGTPLPMPDPVRLGLMDAAGTMTIFSSSEAAILPPGVDTNGVSDVFAVHLPSHFDRDSDTLDDRWEAAMGLDYTSAAGTDGAAGDPDGDGATNALEEEASTHPRGTTEQFLAEGADNAFFRTRLGLANPGAAPATAVVRFDGDDGSSTAVNVHLPAGAKRTVFVDEVGVPTASFATVVESSVPLVAERTVSWDASGYGAHAERASPAPATTWFLAEGATGGFSLFYLLQNPGDTAATATVRYLRPAPLPPIERAYPLPPHSRVTLPVNLQAPELAGTDVSASITATAPILVERAMYRSIDGQPFAAGHASAGVTAASTSWFLAEGATGDFFDLFILLANPNATAAQVEVRYFIFGQVMTMLYTVAAESRRTIYVDGENVGEIGLALAPGPISCAITVTNGVPIVVERSMWFPGPAISPQFWTEAHNSPGATGAATRWVLADGESGGPRDAQTFVLIANTSATAGRVRVTALRDTPTAPQGPAPAPTLVVDVPPNSRTTIPMQSVAGLAGTRFGVLVESVETTPLAQLVVERAMYWNAGGVTWAAGTNLLATPVP